MSAHTPHRPAQAVISPTTVTPQAVTDPTILDSVAGFINEVVPTTYSDSIDVKDQIQWARFEQLDCDESTFVPSCDKVVPSSLLLVLGYSTGVQVWAIPANGEATEICSWRHGLIKALRILPCPHVVSESPVVDLYASKRPLIALCDTISSGSLVNTLSFYSLKTGEQVKLIKFKSPILDILANKKSLVVTFPEKIAVFDAFTLEDKLSITSCYLSPGIQQNPVALGPRWMAYAEKKLITSRRSSGGNEGEGVQSYTATVLHAAKSLGRGLRELGETVASSLTGAKPGTSPNSPQAGGPSDVPQKGVITILDIENQAVHNGMDIKSLQPEAIIAHFTAHTEAIVALQFDPCGLLLLTADKRGHDFHVFKINAHPCGSTLAAVQHLYTLHRGDTSAKVQDMCFSFDSRWAAVSSLRGTTHVFPITPYGGNIGVRTHVSPHVVNKVSRFHRSAGLTGDERSNSPVTGMDSPLLSTYPYHNPRLPPFSHPTVVNPLAQIRQPLSVQNLINVAPRQARHRLTSSSEEQIALRVVSCFAPPRAWIDPAPQARESALAKQVKPVESLFVMSSHGTLVQYDLEPHAAASIPKERVCDESPIELAVIAKAQWVLQRQTDSPDIPLPLTPNNMKHVAQQMPASKIRRLDMNDDDWLSQVEILTHAGPHRRLWMGPQFTFKTYTTTNGTSLSLGDAQAIDLSRSKPVNMPISKANAVLIESSSASSSEQSLLETYQRSYEAMGAAGELQIKEDLADAMRESPGLRDTGGRCVIVSMKPRTPSIAKVVNPLGTVVTVQSDDESDVIVPEDDVIHENCDETLFRPVVAPKALLYQNNKPVNKQYCGNIMMKSLEGNTEVTVRILKKSPENDPPAESSKSAPPTPKPIDTDSINTQSKPKNKKLKPEYKSKPEIADVPVDIPDTKVKSTKKNGKSKPIEQLEKVKQVLDKSKTSQEKFEPSSNKIKSQLDYSTKTETYIESNEKSKPLEQLEKLKPIIEPLETLKPHIDLLEEVNSTLATEPLNILDDFPPLDDDFFSLDSAMKTEKFEDAEDCGLPVFEETTCTSSFSKCSKSSKDLEIVSDSISMTEDTVPEEKSVIKKPRKPKTKLGVKIANINKENTPERSVKEKENTIEREVTPERKSVTPERTLRDSWSSKLSQDNSFKTEINLPKRTWSTITALKPEKPSKASSDEEKVVSIENSLVDSVPSFTVHLPPKNYSSCFGGDKNIENSDVTPEDSVNADENNSDSDLLKIDKSSDDEKAETTGSSGVETTTESDDSGKVLENTTGNSLEDWVANKAPAPTTKAGKKKLKKKKK